MTIPKPPGPAANDEARNPDRPENDEPGSNAVEHEPDPEAKPIADGEHKYVRRSPYTTGND